MLEQPFYTFLDDASHTLFYILIVRPPRKTDVYYDEKQRIQSERVDERFQVVGVEEH